MVESKSFWQALRESIPGVDSCLFYPYIVNMGIRTINPNALFFFGDDKFDCCIYNYHLL